MIRFSLLSPLRTSAARRRSFSWLPLLALAAACAPLRQTASGDTLADFLSGFSTCTFQGTYIENGVAQHPYLHALGTAHRRIEGEFAYYRLHDAVDGLHATELVVPTADFGVVAIKFAESPATARPVLEQRLGVKLPVKSDQAVPVLYADPDNPSASVLDCTNPT